MKKLYTLVLVLFALMSPLIICAQQELTVHNGTVTNEYVPIYGFYADSYLKAEMVYPASELVGMNGATISGMRFYASESSSNWSNPSFRVFLSEVSGSTISAFSGPGTIVYEGTLSINDGVITVDFNQSYTYHGGNLLVGVYNVTPGDGYSSSHWYGETVNGASVSGENYSSLNAISPTQQNFLPKTTFFYTPAGAVTCTRPTQVTVNNVTAHSVTLSWQSDASSWQLCLNDDESNLINVTTNPYTLTGLTSGNTYTAKMRANCSGTTSAWSNLISFTATDNTVIGFGTATNAYLPSHSFYKYSLTQQIYTAEEIGTAGTINTVAFFNGGTEQTRNYDMYIVHTNKESFSNPYDWIAVSASDRVFSGEVTMAANAWTVFNIDGFDYNGTSNIAIVMDDNTGSYSSGMACRVFDATGKTLQVEDDYTNFAPVDSPNYYGNIMHVKNQLILGITPNGAGVCERPSTLVANSVTAHSAVLAWTGGSGTYNVEYKKADDVEWSVYANGVTGSTLTMSNLYQATQYMVRVQSVCADSVSGWKSTFFTTGVASSDHIYVTMNGTGDGSSWQSATNDLQFALNTALDIRNTHGIIVDVWVAAGTYYGDTTDNAFTMVNGVNVYGGFAGNEPATYDLSLRDFAAHASILDGGSARRVLYQTSNFNIQTTWDGFTIQNGQILGNGAGVYLRENGRLSHCKIQGNVSTNGDGGGVYCSYAVVEDCDISGNSCQYDGGGVYAYHATVRRCNIIDNTANYGGGLYVSYYGDIVSCKISHNQSSYSGGGIYMYSSTQVRNCLVENNTSGGSSYSYYGGGIIGSGTIVNSTIVRNTSSSDGAGVYGYDGTVLTNCIVWGNEKNGESDNVAGTPTVSYSAVEGGCVGDSIIVLNDANPPLFVNPSVTAGASDNTSNADWHFQNGSVCANAGNNSAVMDSLDLDGTARVKRDTVDLGCYESDYYSVPVSFCNTVYHEFSDTTCGNYTWNAQTYYWSGDYIQTFGLPNGCDSVVTLHLTVNHNVYAYEYLSICENNLPYTYRDTIFGIGTPSYSTYTFSAPTINGCDSVITLRLTVHSATVGEFMAMTPTNNYPFTSNRVLFTWNAVENASNYDLYVWPVGEAQPQEPVAAQIYGTQYLISNLQNHRDYQWFMKAYNTCDTSVSAVRQFSLNVSPVLTVVANNPLDLGEIPLNDTRSVYFQVTGVALDDSISYQLTGADASSFSLVPTNSWSSSTGGRMQLTFHPTVPQNEYLAQMTIQSGTLVKTITVKGCLSNYLTFTTNVESNVYASGSDIPIHGQVTNLLNQPVAGLEVEVYVKVMDYVRTISATTDANGQFTVTFTPQQSESGYYTVGTRRTGSSDTTVHDDFNIPGMMLASSEWIMWEPTTAQADTGAVLVRNRSQIPLTNIQVTPTSLPNGCTVQFLPLNLAGMATGELQYIVSSSEVSTGQNYQEVRLNAVSNEGAAMSFSVWYFCLPQRADLDVMPTSLITTMNRGKSKVVDFKIYNNGNGPTGGIYVSLPDVPWMSVVGGDTLPSLAVHDSAYVSIRLFPDSTTALIQYTGNIAINCERGEGVSIPYRITAISDSTGSLAVDVTDDYTYNTNNGNGPHLAGASVMVKGYYSLEVVATGVTDSNGVFVANNLPEGWYKLIIRADRHEEYQNNIYITAGETNNQDIFIQFQAITYSWEVVPTEIEDEYTYELVVEYETHVPAPVIVLEMPNTLPALEEGESFTFDYVLTNHGLIAAFDVQLFAPESSIYTFTPLFDRMDSLPAQSTVFIPCVMTRPAQTRAANNATGVRSDSDGDDCPHLIKTSVIGYKLCGGERYPIWAYKYVTDGTTDPCPTWNYIPMYFGGASSFTSGNYGSEPVSTPVAKCECEDELLISDTTTVYGPDSVQYIYCDYIRDCVTGEIRESCDTVVILLNDTNCGIRVSTKPFKKIARWLSNEEDYSVTENVPKKGVAADGKSELEIYVTSQCRLLSSQVFGILSCGSLTDAKYLGSISYEPVQVNDTTLMFIYTAPSEFPIQENKEYKVTLRVMAIVGEGENTETFNVDFPISVVRPPVLFVHGLNGNGDCFASMKSPLRNYYNRWQLQFVDYHTSNTVAFESNERIVAYNINNTFKRYNANGYVVSKADLVGHSMGGILSRLHVEYVDNQNVHKVITVNTPHSGAVFANSVRDGENGDLEPVAKIFMLKSDVEAIGDLRVTSHAIRNYLNNPDKLDRMNGIPVHAIATTVDFNWEDMTDPTTAKIFAAVSALNPLREVVHSIYRNNHPVDYWACVANPVCNVAYNFAPLFPDTAACLLQRFFYNWYKDESDLIVPLASQRAGLADAYVSQFGDRLDKANHSAATDYPPVMNRIVELLKAPTTDGRFSTSGYHPVTLDYPPAGPDMSYYDCYTPQDDNFLMSQPHGLSETRSASTPRSASSSIHVTAEYNAATRIITTSCTTSEDVEDVIFLASLSDGSVIAGLQNMANIEVPATYKGSVEVFAYGMTDSVGFVKDSVMLQVEQYGTTPQNIYFIDDTLYLLSNDTVSPLVMCAWATGDTTYITPIFQSDANILYAENDFVVGRNAGFTSLTALFEGQTASIPVVVYGQIFDYDDAGHGGGTGGDDNDTLSHTGVCASVTVKFSQKMTMTREAFEGTLTINNGHDSDPMQNIDVEFVIRDESGVDCTNLFQINFLSYNNMAGSNGSLVLNAQDEGSIVVQFIPTKHAAPEIAKVYSFGGSFSFNDPFSGESVTYNLYPVDITVHPSPDLYVNYFMQRDILGDDPLTEDRVEPIIPAELGVIIHNRGAGVAKNVLLETAEPQIVDNEKGLAVDFAMYAAAFNGNERQLGLMEIPFGNIEPGHTGVGEWWFTCTLLGHFISYEAHVIHNNSFGNPDLSLVSSLDIHPLIHTVYAYGDLDDGINDFLVDDVEDNQNYPDSLYFSNGSRTAVATADSIGFDHYVTPTDTIVILTLDPSRIGWNYEQTWDPGLGMYELISCTRNSDQQVIPLSNVWQTFVTLPVGADPVYENKLHIVDTLSNDLPTTYTLVYGKRIMALEVDTILNVPDTIISTPLSDVTVVFNKPIVDSTFNYLDMSLKCNNSQNLLDENLNVERIDSMTYKLHLGPYTHQPGYYVLNIQTLNITDVNGFNGYYGKEASWIQNVSCQPDTVSISETVCSSYTWNNIVYTQSGDYVQHFTNISGCDSMVTLHLNVNYGDYSETTVDSCGTEYYWALADTTITHSGTYYHYSTNAINNCTDTAVLILSLYPSATTQIMAQICEGEVYTHNGFNVSAAGDYQLNLYTVHGCDSTVSLHLTIGNENITYVTASICEGDDYFENGFVILNPTVGTHVFSDTTLRPGTCDSVVILTLTVRAVTSGDTTAVANNSFDWYGQHITETGDYTHTFTNAAGCDSVVTLHLTVLSTYYTDIYASECGAYEWNSIIYTASGEYDQTFTAANGCDSVVTLHLTIYDIPTLQSIAGETELCLNQYATYHYDVSDPNYQYKWFKDNVLWTVNVPSVTLHELTVGPVLLTMQVVDTQHGCTADTSLSVQVVNRIAPDTTEIRRKVNSNILFCQPVNSNYGEVHYRWGYTDRNTSAEVVIPGDHNYCLYDFGIDTLLFRYWVETYLNFSIGAGCDNRSYYGYGYIMTSTPDYDDNVVEAYLSDNRIVLYVSSLSFETITVSLYDVNGKMLVSKGYGVTDQVSDAIPVSIAPGVYFLKVSIGGQSYPVKLLKI